MREDIVAGAAFPDYELTDHAGKRRKLSDLQGPDPMILVLSRGGYARRICAKPRVWSNFTARWRSVTPVSLLSVPTICLRRMSTVPALALIGPFYPIRDATFRRTSTSPSTRTPSTIR